MSIHDLFLKFLFFGTFSSLPKRKKCIISLVALSILLTACQPTPEAEAVVNKSDGKLEQVIGADPLPKAQEEYPERLTLAPFGNDAFSVEMDAVVEAPDVGRVPVAEVVGGSYDAAWARTMMERMADGRALYTYETEIPVTKDKIAGEIALIQELLVDPEAHLPKGMSETERKEQIQAWQEEYEALQQAYRSAPDTFDAKPADLSDEWYSVHGRFNAAADFGKRRMTYLEAGASGYVRFNNFEDGLGRLSRYDYASDLMGGNDLSITRDQAVQTGLDFLGSLGLTDFAPSLVMMGCCEPRDATERPLEQWPQAYKIWFTRSVNGVPTAFSVQKYAVDTAEPLYAPGISEGFAVLTIRDAGVVYMDYYDPGTVVRVVNENVALLPFDEIVTRFQQQMLYGFSPMRYEDKRITANTLRIDRVSLGLVEVKKRNDPAVRLLIPAWTFFGALIQTYSEAVPHGFTLNENKQYIDREPGACYLILNAIDGSVIDPAKGY